MVTGNFSDGVYNWSRFRIPGSFHDYMVRVLVHRNAKSFVFSFLRFVGTKFHTKRNGPTSAFGAPKIDAVYIWSNLIVLSYLSALGAAKCIPLGTFRNRG